MAPKKGSGAKNVKTGKKQKTFSISIDLDALSKLYKKRYIVSLGDGDTKGGSVAIRDGDTKGGVTIRSPKVPRKDKAPRKK